MHEGPIGIGTRVQFSEVPLSAGNVISDEPGYYEDGKFGIRIESGWTPTFYRYLLYLLIQPSFVDIIVVKEAETKHKFGDKPFLGFDHVTMVPMCRKLIDPGLLSPEERDWLNSYHKEVEEKTLAFFEGDKRTLDWLHKETRPI